MSTAAHPADGTPRPSRASFLDRHYFLLRRLHSLLGIAPIGFFLFPHLFTNSSIVWGRWLGGEHTGTPMARGVETFQHEVDFIHNLPGLPLIEIGVLWLPLLYHAGFGFYYARQGSNNTARYAYQGNARYLWQRITGYVAFAFILLHVLSLRFGWTFGGLFPTFDPDAAASSTAVHFQNGRMGLLMAVLYLVCVLSIVYHFANGLWTAAITWGLTVSEGAMRRWGHVCTGIGLTLAGAAVAAIIGFSTLDVPAAQMVERGMVKPSSADKVTPPAEAVEHRPTPLN